MMNELFEALTSSFGQNRVNIRRNPVLPTISILISESIVMWVRGNAVESAEFAGFQVHITSVEGQSLARVETRWVESIDSIEGVVDIVTRNIGVTDPAKLDTIL